MSETGAGSGINGASHDRAALSPRLATDPNPGRLEEEKILQRLDDFTIIWRIGNFTATSVTH